MLVGSTYTPDKSHDTYSEVSSHEVSNGNGYTTGGEELTSQLVIESDAGDSASFYADNITWSSLTKEFNHVVLYDNTLPNKDLILCLGFGETQTITNMNFSVNFSNTKILSSYQE